VDDKGYVQSTIGQIAAVAGLTVLVVTAGAVLRMVHRGRCRCPHCGNKNASLVDRDSRQFLVCGVCQFDEPTGWFYN
jgi:hypothetical protein